MRITIYQAEIEEAIEAYILEQIVVPDEVAEIGIDLKATRGEEGYQAIITIGDSGSAFDPAEGASLKIVEKIEAARATGDAPRRRGRPAGSKNKPKADPAPVEAVTDVASATVAGEAVVDTPEPTAVVEASEPVENIEPEVETVKPVEEDTALAPAATVVEADVSAQAPEELVETISDAEPEPNSEAALAAEAQVTEPVQTEQDQADAEPVVPTTAPRSLFGGLTKPTNG